MCQRLPECGCQPDLGALAKAELQIDRVEAASELDPDISKAAAFDEAAFEVQRDRCRLGATDDAYHLVEARFTRRALQGGKKHGPDPLSDVGGREVDAVFAGAEIGWPVAESVPSAAQ